MTKEAKFNIGDCVRHQQHGYRAVIVDIDPLFQASGRYNPQASKREFATRSTWYRLLVDESSQITYVEEDQLILDKGSEQIDNPRLPEYLIADKKGYRSCIKKH
ncbi:putative DNA-binding protein hemimethylated [Legionella birminghamensis]|uniref:Heat shock protein HspQ n=1 Tax=Legionella birminghamensis TaxID=28083 RepID=A0A378IDE7_9GAMM|nr:heat shock protein HspQ [Legionella birminghamensis]KTC68700.1 putative DNA-binding protein hemimethylated [Legionella birminghamensis]STX30314.1 putative DNA-binding protein hemimethylated [Legionella birminghamensis]